MTGVISGVVTPEDKTKSSLSFQLANLLSLFIFVPCFIAGKLKVLLTSLGVTTPLMTPIMSID